MVLGVLDYPFLLKEKIEDTSVWFKMSKQVKKFQRLTEESCTVHAKFPKGNTQVKPRDSFEMWKWVSSPLLQLYFRGEVHLIYKMILSCLSIRRLIDRPSLSSQL